MRDYREKLRQLIGAELTEELIQYTLQKVAEKFGKMRKDKLLKITNINLMFLLDQCVLNSSDDKKEQIASMIRQKYKTKTKYLLSLDDIDFQKMYKKYFDLIVKKQKNNMEEY